MRLSIIIPAHNEEKRIGETLENYFKFFDKTSKTNNFEYELIVVLSGCNDKTGQVAESYRNPSLRIIDVKKKGKGLAVKEGFKDALERDNDLIGFVDADMATFPEDFFDLFKHIGSADGMIANRYDPRPSTSTYNDASCVATQATACCMARSVAARMPMASISEAETMPTPQMQCLQIQA
jgi:glycosyltransferase involved in cell wall biosynthesis